MAAGTRFAGDSVSGCGKYSGEESGRKRFGAAVQFSEVFEGFSREREVRAAANRLRKPMGKGFAGDDPLIANRSTAGAPQ
jgi:hypothetical protein